MMVGRELSGRYFRPRPPPPCGSDGASRPAPRAPCCRRGSSRAGHGRRVSFTVARGEILGFAAWSAPGARADGVGVRRRAPAAAAWARRQTVRPAPAPRRHRRGVPGDRGSQAPWHGARCGRREYLAAQVGGYNRGAGSTRHRAQRARRGGAPGAPGRRIRQRVVNRRAATEKWCSASGWP